MNRRGADCLQFHAEISLTLQQHYLAQRCQVEAHGTAAHVPVVGRRDHHDRIVPADQ